MPGDFLKEIQIVYKRQHKNLPALLLLLLKSQLEVLLQVLELLQPMHF